MRKVLLAYLILVAVSPGLAKNTGGAGEPVPVNIEQIKKAPDTISQNKGLELYSSYYQKNAGQVEVYYDSVEDGKLVGGKVLLALPPVLEYQSTVQAPLAPSSWSYETVIDSGPSENRIDIVVVGDGYTQSELNKYQLNVNSILSGYFAQQPLASYINFFNVHRVDVISSESGVDEPDKGIYRDTALDMTYNCSGISRLLCVSTAKAWDAASAAPDADQILALANSTRYGGAGYSNLATIAGDNNDSAELALHEFGHSFGVLADEYSEGETYTGPEPSQINISIYNAQQQTALQTKWYRWLNLPNVDTYEGAYYYLHGIYRPTSNSKMRSLNRPFEEVNVEQIIFRIYENVSIIDDSTPLSEEPVPYYTYFYVTTVEPTPDTISIQWRIDGQLVPDANAKTFSPDISAMTIGLHEISVTVTDNTSMVRDEIKRAQLMTKSLQWQIDVTKYAGGTGEPNSPYQIAHVADLMRLANDANDYNKCFILTADIDLDPNLPGNQVFATAVIARDINNANWFFDGNSFSGIFDGAGHKVINLTIRSYGDKKSYLGLFGDVCECEIKNLGLENVFISSDTNSAYVGGLIGSNDHFSNLNSVRDCHSSGSIVCGSGSHFIGGLAGWNNGNISNSFSEIAVTVGDKAGMLGGLVGVNKGPLANCFATGNVAGGNDSVSLGGLVADYFADINNCYSTGNVSGGNNSRYLGGLAAYCYFGNISNCYSTGNVTGGNNSNTIGGLIAAGQGISNCYSTGTVSGGSGSNFLGGLAATGNPFSITSCYFLTGSGPNNHLGTPLTDTQMKQQASFVGWDFNNVWHICETTNYPKLTWQILPGDIACPDGVDFEDIAELCDQWLVEEIPADLSPPPSGNGIVDFADFAVFAGQWGITNGVDELLDFTGQWLKTGLPACSADISSDGRVNFADFALMANNWLKGF